MTNEEFNQKFNEVLGVFADRPAAEIPETARLREDLGLDELDVVEFIMTIEEEFEIVLSEEEAVECETVGDFRELVRKEAGGIE